MGFFLNIEKVELNYIFAELNYNKMKKISLLFLAIITLFSCTKEAPLNYITLKGKLENNKEKTLTISDRRNNTIKTITINEDGTFKDTLKVDKADIYVLQTSNIKKAPIYLKNSFDIYLEGNANDFMNSFKFSGKGAENSSYIIAQVLESQKIGNPQLIVSLEKEEFTEKINNIEEKFDSILNSYNELDSAFASMINIQNKQMINSFKQANDSYLLTGKGRPSPKFQDYLDYKGGKKSLDSFKGKYVYLDIWATWCGPCIQQIPYLKDLEKEYHNKNIEFVSISTDEPRKSGGSWEAAEKKWRNFVKERQLTGTQLWSGQDYSFQQAYQINGIPRFILIDPKGNIVDANAPRPSEPRLKQLFTSLGI
ncbi:TlpA family protein disulfide reductase [Polaribacter sp.]|uniref:TlpA family protein disulfide reductase n=1 Tax=Polaribacter sp. TaxID=1920175 RepID=UPI003F6BE4CE